MNSLTKKQRLRRVLQLCCHSSKNFAYYRTGYNRMTDGKSSQILVTINSNFLDMAVLDWCKLFGDKRGKHYWKKVVSNHMLEGEMLAHLDQSDDQFEGYIKEVRHYRDKFIAHLDDRNCSRSWQKGVALSSWI